MRSVFSGCSRSAGDLIDFPDWPETCPGRLLRVADSGHVGERELAIVGDRLEVETAALVLLQMLVTLEDAYHFAAGIEEAGRRCRDDGVGSRRRTAREQDADAPDRIASLAFIPFPSF